MSERSDVEHAIAALESQRALLGDAVVEIALAPLREKLAALASAAQEQQRKHATILFADVSGFTALSETMDAEDVNDIMNALWQQLDTIITQHGGVIDKHIGDAIMAIWGAHIARENDPEQAIRAALAMQAALTTMRAAQPVALFLRIGINTGPVLVGTVGTTNEFTAMGDAVNLASRLEHAAPVGGILISHDTYRHVRGLFDVEVRAPLQVKGKAQPIQTYVVEQAKPRSFALPARGIEGVETRMIGRDTDLLFLQQAIRAVITDREAQSITVVGDAGIGKSRLLYELRSWIELIPERITLFLGRATQETRRRPYALLRDIFAFRFGIHDSDTAVIAREKLMTGWLEMLGEQHPEVLRKGHLMGHLLGFDFSESPLVAGIVDDPRQLRYRALQAISELFTAFSQQDPVLIAVEDTHWADDASLDALVALTESCASLPMLLLYMSRPTLFEHRPAWGEGDATHTRLTLQPLSRGDSRRLVEHILRYLPTIPHEIRELIVRGADGNPFYVEELIKMLIEQGGIVPDATTWRVVEDRLSTIEVPPTLTGVLQARLDSLHAEERTVLQHAAVIGRTFWDQAVEHGHSPGVCSVHAALAALRQHELIYRHETSTFAAATEYLFKHALLRDVTYETLLKRQRRIYHAHAAAWLIAASGDRVDAYASVIAGHYDLAGSPVEASQWYVRAGQHAQAAYANEDALLAYTKAQSLLPAGAQAEVLLQLGSVYEVMGQWDAAEACYQTALAESARDQMTDARLQRGYGILWQLRGRYPEALPLLQGALATFQNLGNHQEMCRTLTEIGVVYWRQTNYAAANQILEESLGLARRVQDRRQVATILHYLGTVAMHQTRYRRAYTQYGESLEVASALGDKYRLCRTTNNMGLLAYYEGNYDLAKQRYTDALTLAYAVGDRWMVATILGNLGEVADEQQHITEAETYHTQSLALCRELGDQRGIAMGLENLGWVAYRRADLVAAKAMMQESFLLFRDLEAKQDSVRILMKMLAFVEQDLEQIQIHYAHALKLALVIDTKHTITEGLIGIAATILQRATAPAWLAHVVQLLAATTTLLTASGSVLERDYRDLYDRTLDHAKVHLSEPQFDDAWKRGTALTLNEMVDVALAHLQALQ